MDKRRCLRYEIELPATFKVYPTQSHISVASSLNISAKGLCLNTKEKLGPGQGLQMQIRLPNADVIRIFVKVIWVQEMMVFNRVEYKVGVEIGDEMKAEEAKFVKYCADVMLEEYYKNKRDIKKTE